MTADAELDRLLGSLLPVVRDGEYVFISLTGAPAVPCEATIAEDEGLTCVVRRTTADEMGWPYDFVAGWITLRVHSDLAAVGLTAAFSDALASAGLPCNVLAGYFHDHVLVPIDRVDDALAVLGHLSARHRREPGQGSPHAARHSPDR